VQLRVTTHPEWGTDIHAHGELGWGDDACLQFYVSTQAGPHQGARVVGEKGWAELVVPFNAPVRVSVRHCPEGGFSTKATMHDLAPVNQYAEMVRHFAAACAADEPTDLSESRMIADVLLRLRASAGI
jgi:hypothetical protein